VAWDIEKSLAQQKAIEESERLLKQKKQERSEAILSQVAEENSGIAHSLGLSRLAFHSLASEPDLFHKFMGLVSQEQTEITKVTNEPLNPKNRTQKTSVGTGNVYNTTKWDPAFKWVPKMESNK